MSLTFGKIGLATSAGGDGLVVPEHYPAARDGDEVTIECDLYESTVADQKILRGQFLGYDLNPDERVIPVTSTQDPTLDGFYRVQGVAVDDTVGTHITGGIGSKVVAELLKVPGWQAPRFEVLCDGADRGGGSVATGEFWVFGPSTSDAWVSITTAAAAGRANFDGGVFYDTAGSSPFSAEMYYAIDAPDFYRASVLLETTSDSGSTWRSLVGRQIDADAEGGWRMSTQEVRLSTNTSGQLVVSWNGGTAASPSWESTTFVLTYDTPTDYTEFKKVTVLHNRPEVCSVRLTLEDSTNRNGAYVDLTLRRGATFIEGNIVNPRAVTETFGIRRTASEAATSITGGIEATAADANGNKFTLLSPSTITKTTAGQSGIRLTSAARSLPFCVATVNTFQGITLTQAYFATMNHRQQIVAR